MLLVPPGTFNMGCTVPDPTICDITELPVHAVTLTNAFYLGRYEVTQAQWTARMGSNPSFHQNASALGLHDMLGNAMEWVNDRYSSTYYASSPLMDPPGPATGTDRVLRGGDYGWDSSGVRASTRSNAPASFSIGIATGFRVARNP